MLLHHAIKHEYGGWRVWVDTLAIVHSKVSYEEFKLQFAQMYEHYERHRTDNITDPALRRAHPISTISGWDQDRDDSSAADHIKIEEIKGADNNQTNNYHATNGISDKSDQTNDVDMDNVKCACEGDDQQRQPQQPQLSANKDEEAPKLVSSISSISDVYNKQINGETICDGNRLDDVSEETSVGTPEKEAAGSGQEALKQVLEIDSYEKEEESKEIVEEIIENILQKSEALLEDCKNASDLITHDSTSSPVIKDEEIELAVSEVVKGVLEIEKIKRDNETTLPEVQTTVSSSETNDISEANDALIIKKSLNIDNNVTDDSIKTDLLLSTATIANNNQTISETKDDDTNDDIQGIITNIVHEVIDNCLEQTILNDNEKCDNNNSEAGVTQTAVEVVEKVLEDAVVGTAAESSPNTNEEIAKSILYEIVDKCVRGEVAADEKEEEENNNDDSSVTATPPSVNVNNEKTEVTAAVSEKSIAQTAARMDVEGGNNVESNSTSNKPASVHNERRPQSASTSTQVENNHFGECSNRKVNRFLVDCSPSIILDAKQSRPKSGSTRPMFSPGPTRPPFRIPEFKWSYIHQRLLSDVLFSLETDIQVSIRSLCDPAVKR